MGDELQDSGVIRVSHLVNTSNVTPSRVTQSTSPLFLDFNLGGKI
jgi:hypothetical protein